MLYYVFLFVFVPKRDFVVIVFCNQSTTEKDLGLNGFSLEK